MRKQQVCQYEYILDEREAEIILKALRDYKEGMHPYSEKRKDLQIFIDKFES